MASNGKGLNERIQFVNLPAGAPTAYEIVDIDSVFGNILRKYHDDQILRLQEPDDTSPARRLIEVELVAEGRGVSIDRASLKSRIFVGPRHPSYPAGKWVDRSDKSVQVW